MFQENLDLAALHDQAEIKAGSLLIKGSSAYVFVVF